MQNEISRNVDRADFWGLGSWRWKQGSTANERSTRIVMLERRNIYNDLRVTRRDNLLRRKLQKKMRLRLNSCGIADALPCMRSGFQISDGSLRNGVTLHLDEPHAQHPHSSLPSAALLRLNSIGQRYATAP